MPDLIRLLPLGEDERRRRPRRPISPEESLIVGVALMGAAGRPRTLTGRVRDISEAGLSLLLPGDEVCGELGERGRALAVVLTLPSGTIRLRAEVAHCGRHEGAGYVLGISVTEMDAVDHGRLADYVAGLAG